MTFKLFDSLHLKLHDSLLRGHVRPIDSNCGAAAELSEAFHRGGLSANEATCAELAARGHSSAEIAELMGVKPPTVRTYLQRSYKKLGISGIEELRQLAGSSSGLSGDLAPKSSQRHGSEIARKRKLQYLMGRSLSEAEARIALEVAAGKSGPSIADELHYSAGTVNAARHKAYRLLGVHTSAEFASKLEQETFSGLADASLVEGNKCGFCRGVLMPCAVALSVVALIGCAFLAKASIPAEGLVPAMSQDGTFGYVYQADLDRAATDPIDDPSQAVDLMELKQQRLATNLAEELNAVGTSRIYTVADAQELLDEGWASSASYYSSRGIDIASMCSPGGKELSVTAEELARAYEYASASSARHIDMFAADGTTVIGSVLVG